jgi:hypothetical protein
MADKRPARVRCFRSRQENFNAKAPGTQRRREWESTQSRRVAKAQEYFKLVSPSLQTVRVGFEGNFDSCPLRLGTASGTTSGASKPYCADCVFAPLRYHPN